MKDLANSIRHHRIAAVLADDMRTIVRCSLLLCEIYDDAWGAAHCKASLAKL